MLVKRLPCICCEIEDVPQPSRTEAHHQNLGGHAGQIRLGDKFQIPLCAWHHRGVVPEGMTKSEATFEYGPALPLDSKQFRFCYGTDEQLLELTNLKLARLMPATA
jgi:hypothetical protein